MAFFERKIRPLLIENCYECHSEERGKTKGGLALDSRAGWQEGGLSGEVIVPGDVEASLLIQAVRRGDPDTAMPPKKELPPDAVRALEQWVKMGAPDPRESRQQSPALASAETLWSLQPVRNPPVPPVAKRGWPRTDVDAFVLTALRENKLVPSADASLSALARRLWFVLIGLPPTPAELAAFGREMQSTGDAERVLSKWADTLIASPQFGEKWARHWLDVARYAETNGKALNNGLPYAWRYRDWVIAAINADKPFDRFLTEQIAGDLLPASSQAERDTLNIATGFFAIGSKEHFGGCGDRTVAEVQPEWVDDQINVLGRGVLGLNVSCSRCHDHKFDPVPTRDYYALAGIFFSTEILSGRKGGDTPDFVKRIFDPDLVLLGDQAVAAELQPVEERRSAIQEKIAPLRKMNAMAGDEEERKPLQAQIKVLDAEMEALRKEAPPVEWAFGLREAQTVANTTIRKGGVWNQPGEAVPRGFLSAVKVPNPPAIAAQASGRLELARWLTDPHHPLTARVFVNRIWQQVFGEGIVSTTDNFGMNGEPPSHPALLDFLAHRFMHAQEWSPKKLVRDLVLSRTFRQSSAPTDSATGLVADPANRLLWRMNNRRLDAEAIRDSVLAVSGRLELAPRRGTAPMLTQKFFGGLNQKDITTLRPEESLLRHRAVYLTIIRNESLDDILAAFDFPNNDEPITQRAAASVPAQALVMMNHPLIIESARHLATGIGAVATDDAERVRQAFVRVLGREPAAAEAAEGIAFLQTASDALAMLCQGLFQSAEFRLLL